MALSSPRNSKPRLLDCTAQIDQVTVASDVGDEYQDTLTDNAVGSESNLFGIAVDSNDEALTSLQQGEFARYTVSMPLTRPP